jgi:hypothetical protein
VGGGRKREREREGEREGGGERERERRKADRVDSRRKDPILKLAFRLYHLLPHSSIGDIASLLTRGCWTSGRVALRRISKQNSAKCCYDRRWKECEPKSLYSKENPLPF